MLCAHALINIFKKKTELLLFCHVHNQKKIRVLYDRKRQHFYFENQCRDILSESGKKIT